MSTYQLKSHNVTAVKIDRIEPLIIGGQLVGPNQGVSLRTSEGKGRWTSEPNVPTPEAGDYLVTDAELRLKFVVPAALFESLFQVA